MLRRIATRRGREAEGVVLLEGPRTVETALDHGAVVSFALCVSGASGRTTAGLRERLTRDGADILDVTEGAFRAFASTESPQGLLAVAKEPRVELPVRPSTPSPRVLLLDRVREPGNVGTLIRVAAAFGLERVLALDGTADPWGAKAVRASAGLAFALPIHGVAWEDARIWLEGAALPLLVADGGGEDVRTWVSARAGEGLRGWALLLGNEGSGPRPEAVRWGRTRLAVPVAPGVESLNVAAAGAVLMWALGPGRPGSGVTGGAPA
jgi:TrmH family RNA methyltransferase